MLRCRRRKTDSLPQITCRKIWQSLDSSFWDTRAHKQTDRHADRNTWHCKRQRYQRHYVQLNWRRLLWLYSDYKHRPRIFVRCQMSKETSVCMGFLLAIMTRSDDDSGYNRINSCQMHTTQRTAERSTFGYWRWIFNESSKSVNTWRCIIKSSKRTIGPGIPESPSSPLAPGKPCRPGSPDSPFWPMKPCSKQQRNGELLLRANSEIAILHVLTGKALTTSSAI